MDRRAPERPRRPTSAPRQPRRADTVPAGTAPTALTLAALTALAACGPVATGGPCIEVGAPVSLGKDLSEVSGVAVSLEHPGHFWVHNDAQDVLWGVDVSGAVTARVSMPFDFRDWEDLALGTCPGGGSCLYAADIGDNYEEHGRLRLVRFPEPHPDAGSVPSVDVFPMRIADGPRDMETMLLLPGERFLFVTKGRNHPITVYRYPGPLRPDTVLLEAVQTLSDGPRILPRQATGGATSPVSQLVAIRTYQSFRFYRIQGDTLAETEHGPINLRTLNERQGEGIALGPDGQVVLTSEGGPGGGAGSMAVLRCGVDGL